MCSGRGRGGGGWGLVSLSLKVFAPEVLVWPLPPAPAQSGPPRSLGPGHMAGVGLPASEGETGRLETMCFGLRGTVATPGSSARFSLGSIAMSFSP